MPEDTHAGYLTTHVLDTAGGCPAANMKIELFAIDGDNRRLLSSATTNSDGRTDKPMLAGADFAQGTYELVFHAGEYIRATASGIPEVPFLDIVPIRFGISDTGAHYHVPLLVSPFAYSTYRGS